MTRVVGLTVGINAPADFRDPELDAVVHDDWKGE